MRKAMCRTGLAVTCLASGAIALTPSSYGAKAAAAEKLYGHQFESSRPYIFGIGRNKILNGTSRITGTGGIILKGATMRVDGKLIIPSGRKVLVAGGALEGKGRIEIQSGGQLIFNGASTKRLRVKSIVNRGKVEWGGT